MMRRERDLLHDAVVASAVILVALVAWLGGRRLWGRWWGGHRPALAAQTPPAADDGIDHPPPVLPPLALAGVKAPKRKRREEPAPAVRPLPPITPDKR